MNHFFKKNFIFFYSILQLTLEGDFFSGDGRHVSKLDHVRFFVSVHRGAFIFVTLYLTALSLVVAFTITSFLAHPFYNVLGVTLVISRATAAAIK